jgi:hypothetical protein
MEIVGREGQLLQIVGALRPTGRFAGRLHGRQQERDQDTDDGDHHQEFDQREAAQAWWRLDAANATRFREWGFVVHLSLLPNRTVQKLGPVLPPGAGPDAPADRTTETQNSQPSGCLTVGSKERAKWRECAALAGNRGFHTAVARRDDDAARAGDGFALRS